VDGPVLALTGPEQAVTTPIVLVHGAWADATGFDA
jgi:pimeloyl-ACP methyl ester carboxylesterase